MKSKKRRHETLPKKGITLLIIELLTLAGQLIFILTMYLFPSQFEVNSDDGTHKILCITHLEGTYCCDSYKAFKVKKDSWTHEIEITRCYKHVAFDSTNNT